MRTKLSVDLTPQEIKVIEGALQTQEKILSLQTHAGGDKSTKLRLSEIKHVIERLRHRKDTPDAGTWGNRAMSLFL